MRGGTLLASRYTNLLPHFKTRLEALGFTNVTVTDKDRDALTMLINELKPRRLFISSHFCSIGTPLMVGELCRIFPDLYIAAINTSAFSDKLAAWFIFHGAKSYVNLLDGIPAFHNGLHNILKGNDYIAPNVQKIIDAVPEWPDCSDKETKRQKEILLMVCNALKMECIQKKLHISKNTVNFHLKSLYKAFHVSSREELVKAAVCLDIVTKDDLIFSENDYSAVKLPAWAEYMRLVK